MAAVARLYTFTDGTDAYGSQVEAEYNTIFNAWNNHDAGTSKWTVVSALNAAATPLIADNSTGTNNIFDAKDNGTIIFSLINGGQAQFVVGSASAPGICFIGDTNSGIFWGGADDIRVAVNGTTRFFVNTTAVTISGIPLTPNGAGSISTGDAADYWNDISYKTLTDRGCLGWFDEGVELQDGTKVSDVKSIEMIGKHPTKKTIYGIPMLDYKTFPKVAYRKAEKNGVAFPRDVNDEPVGASDGIEMTSMFSIMLGAIKELGGRLKVLEGK